MKVSEHPSFVAAMQRPSGNPSSLEVAELRQLCLEAEAEDCGVVELGRSALQDQRQDIEAALPGARSLMSFVVRMNRGSIRSPARSVANVEFHHGGDVINEIGHRLVRAL